MKQKIKSDSSFDRRIVWSFYSAALAGALFGTFLFSSESHAQGMKSYNSRNLVLCLLPRDVEGKKQRRVVGIKVPESFLKKNSIKNFRCPQRGAIKIDRNNVDILGLSDEELNAFNTIVNNYLNFGNTPGPKGDKGDRGEPGLNGAPGAPGIKGDKGDPGRDGADGAQGPAGPRGEKGDKGDPGLNGSDGAQGPAGPKGEKGDKGDPGEDGLDGAQGPEGPRGPAGADGFGSSGCTIINGSSAGGRHINVSATCPDPEDVVVTYAANSSGWQSSTASYHYAQVGARLDNSAGGPLPNRVTVAFECIETDALSCQGRSGSASIQIMCCR